MKVRPNLLDRVISAVAPQAGLARMRARYAEESFKRHYEGASVGRRTAGWTAPSSSGNSALWGIQRLRDRARDLYRNDAWVGAAHDVITTETVGTGIVARWSSPELQALWDAWVPVAGAGGLDFNALQALVMDTVTQSGSALVRIRPRLLADDLPVPMQLQVLEPDHLDSTKDALSRDGSEVKQGIAFDAKDDVLGYWLFRRHPGEIRLTGGWESVFVPGDRVAHVFVTRRPGMVLDAPWGSRVLIRARDFADFEDAHLLRQKVAGSWAAFTHDMASDADLTAPSSSSTAKKYELDEIEPGTIEDLPPGKDITFANPPGVSGYREYTSTMLRAIARGFGISYEALTGDYSQVNFASGRMGEQRMRRNIDRWRWQMLVPKFLTPVAGWFLEAAALEGVDTRGATVRWTAPKHVTIDPQGEVRATKDEIRSGLTSLSEAIRERGEDPDEILGELATDLKRLDELGLVLDSDGRPHPYSPGQQTQVPAAKPAASAGPPKGA